MYVGSAGAMGVMACQLLHRVTRLGCVVAMCWTALTREAR